MLANLRPHTRPQPAWDSGPCPDAGPRSSLLPSRDDQRRCQHSANTAAASPGAAQPSSGKRDGGAHGDRGDDPAAGGAGPHPGEARARPAEPGEGQRSPRGGEGRGGHGSTEVRHEEHRQPAHRLARRGRRTQEERDHQHPAPPRAGRPTTPHAWANTSVSTGCGGGERADERHGSPARMASTDANGPMAPHAPRATMRRKRRRVTP